MSVNSGENEYAEYKLDRDAEERLLDRHLPWHHWRLPCNAGEWFTTNLVIKPLTSGFALLVPTYRTDETHWGPRFGSLR